MLITIRGRFFRILTSVMAACVVFFWSSAAIALPSTFSSISWVADLQGSQFTEQPAVLVGPRENSAIALYIRPAPNQQPVGYGMSGDAVTITDQFGDYLMEDDPSATWSHIRLEKPPYTEGWLRGRFLLMPSADELSE
ncbi:MAG: hypothetical protein AAF171_11295 [Cyanobacteria bacterium P01_A01_bin.116]